LRLTSFSGPSRLIGASEYRASRNAGKTKGYKNHPQLVRFRDTETPGKYINEYLYVVLLEAKDRNYNFDMTKINIVRNCQN